MVSLKKRFVVGIALLMLLIATVMPVGAQDTQASTSPTNGMVTSTTSSLTLPIRCGNNC